MNSSGQLARTLLSLAIGELGASIAFLLVFLGAMDNRHPVGIAVSFAFLEFLLLQGTAYWLLRYRALVTDTPIARNSIRRFALLNNINQVLGVAVLIFVLTFADGFGDMLVGLALWLFAVVEYVNYYHYRLSYGRSGFNIARLLNTGLRQSSLRRMINRMKR